MTYINHRPDRLRPSILSYNDWLIASLALAAGAAAFLLMFYLLMWLIGMPGPLLWMGSSDRLADIASVTAGVTFVTFFCNMLGAIVIIAFTAIRRRFRKS